LTDIEAATIGLSVSAGLLAAHAAGIIHRDVKPGNVLICSDGRIKLTDFGIARSTGEQSITATGLLLGSPAFISPEVASGAPADPRTDAWGLGALLFACVQGVPPYDRGTPLATLTAVVQDPVPPHPRSGRLSGIIRGLLMKDPAARMSVAIAHQSLRHIATDTGRLVSPRLPPTRITAPPPAPVRPGADPTRRSPGPLTASGDRSAPDALPPPPWATAGGADSLRPLPLRAGKRSRRQQVVLAMVTLLIGVVAALAGFLAVRVIAHVQTGVPIISFSATLGSASPPE
jgi:serine/threonine protein kinase